MAKKKHNEDKKLHNSEEKLHNSRELDLSWQETVDLQPEDESEDGSEIYYFVDQDGNIHSREFLSEELIPDDAEDSADSVKRKSSHVKAEKLKPGTTDVVNLIPRPEQTARELVLPVPKSGARPLDIRISSEVAAELPTKEESRQPSDVVDDDKQIIIQLGDGTSLNEATSVAQDRASKQLVFSFSRDALDKYVAYRSEGIAKKSKDWINRASQALWDSTHNCSVDRLQTRKKLYRWDDEQ